MVSLTLSCNLSSWRVAGLADLLGDEMNQHWPPGPIIPQVLVSSSGSWVGCSASFLTPVHEGEPGTELLGVRAPQPQNWQRSAAVMRG